MAGDVNLKQLRAMEYGMTAGHDGEPYVDLAAKRVAALEAEVAALRKDAERYRWLREQCNTTTNLVQYNFCACEYTIPCHSAKDMDDAIDAAMRRTAAVGAA